MRCDTGDMAGILSLVAILSFRRWQLSSLRKLTRAAIAMAGGNYRLAVPAGNSGHEITTLEYAGQCLDPIRTGRLLARYWNPTGSRGKRTTPPLSASRVPFFSSRLHPVQYCRRSWPSFLTHNPVPSPPAAARVSTSGSRTRTAH